MNIRHNLSLILGLSIPVLMIIGVAISIYIPQMFAEPTYDFVYALGNNDYYGNNTSYRFYEVRNASVVKNDVPPYIDPVIPAAKPVPQIPPRLYRHDVKANRSTEISFAGAKELKLDPSQMSPDGFEAGYGQRSGGGFPFIFDGGYNDYNSVYLIGHHASLKQNMPAIATDNYSYYNQFHFLGWVLP